MATEVKVPTLGESITEATLGAVAQAARRRGQAPDEPIASLETDKVAIEVPSPVAGTMGEQLRQGRRHGRGRRGDRADRGRRGRRRGRRQAALPDLDAGQSARARARIWSPATAEAERRGRRGPHLTLSPAVRRIVLEHHLDPSKIKGTGKDGRLTKDDVLAAAEGEEGRAARPRRPPLPPPAPPPPPPPAPAPPAGERREERVRMTRLRQTVARRLKEAQNTAAMLTTFNDVDMIGGDRGARAATRICSRRSTASASASWASS